MSKHTLEQLIARVEAQDKAPAAIRKATQSALRALTPQGQKKLRAQLGIRVAEKEDPVRALARELARKKRER